MKNLKIILDSRWIKHNSDLELKRTINFKYNDNMFTLTYRISNIIDPTYTVLSSGLKYENINPDKWQYLLNYEDYMQPTIQLTKSELQDIDCNDIPTDIVKDFDKFFNLCKNVVIQRNAIRGFGLAIAINKCEQFEIFNNTI